MEDEEEKRRGEEAGQSVIKSRDPHLAGGEKRTDNSFLFLYSIYLVAVIYNRGAATICTTGCGPGLPTVKHRETNVAVGTEMASITSRHRTRPQDALRWIHSLRQTLKQS